MPTVHEILRQTGFSDSEIANLDGRAVNAFDGVLTSAQQQREAAELAQRSNAEFYENTISPALNNWDLEKSEIANARAKAEAEAAFYRAQNEAARAGGFVPTDSPTFASQQRGTDGRYVAGPSGSPTFEGNASDIEQKLANGLSNLAWTMTTYQRLNNSALPDDIDTLAAEASRSGRPFRDYVSGKYNFAQKEREVAEKRQREHDDRIRTEAITENDRKWAERTGSNPDIKAARSSALAEVARGVQAGQRPDPLKMSDVERQRATQKSIHDRILERQVEG